MNPIIPIQILSKRIGKTHSIWSDFALNRQCPYSLNKWTTPLCIALETQSTSIDAMWWCRVHPFLPSNFVWDTMFLYKNSHIYSEITAHILQEKETVGLLAPPLHDCLLHGIGRRGKQPSLLYSKRIKITMHTDHLNRPYERSAKAQPPLCLFLCGFNF